MISIDRFYQKQQEILGNIGFPSRITNTYRVKSCQKYENEEETTGRFKGVFTLEEKQTGGMAYMRMSKKDFQSALREGGLLGKLEHPAIPKVLDCFVEEGTEYLVREYAQGESLYYRIKRYGVLGTREVFRAMGALCDVLGYLHRRPRPIIHRDLVPENIIWTGDGQLKLIDFGIARTVKPGQPRDTLLVGAFPAPEATGKQTDARTDIWNLGHVLHFMATGHLQPGPDVPAVTDKRLWWIISRCIREDPADRFQSVDELVRYDSYWRWAWEYYRMRRAAAITCVCAGLACLLLVPGTPPPKTQAVVGEGAPAAAQEVVVPPTPREVTQQEKEHSAQLIEGSLLAFERYWDTMEDEYIWNEELQAMERHSSVQDLENMEWDKEIHYEDYYILCFMGDHYYVYNYEDKDYTLIKEHQYTDDGELVTQPGEISDVSILSQCKTLKYLTLYNQRISDLSPLQGMVIRELDVERNEIVSLEPLAGLPNLEHLYINSNPVYDLSPLSGLENLYALDISDTLVRDLRPLRTIKSLRALALRGLTFENLDPLYSTDLFHLNVSGCTLGDFEYVRDYDSFFSLDVSYTGMTEPLRINSTALLEYYNISGCEVENLEGLGKFAALRVLVARDTELESIEGVGENGGLWRLDISNTKVSDISPVLDLTELQVLEIEGCQIENLSVLLEVSHRLTVNCRGLLKEEIDLLRQNPLLRLVEESVYVDPS